MKRCQVEAMFQNAKTLQQDVVRKLSLDLFESGILHYQRCDLITMNFALTYMLENKNEILNEFTQGENNERN